MTEFYVKKRTGSRKMKLMLWIDTQLVERIEQMKHPEITNQEAIRQIVESAVTEHEAMAGL